MARAKVLYPFPVYEAHLSNGGRLRLSFASPAGKPVDFAAGRKALEEIYFNDSGNDRGRTWSRGADGAWRAAWPKRHCGITIVRGFVQHETLGPAPVEHVATVAAPKAKPANWRSLALAARNALESGDAKRALELLQTA